MLIVLNPYLLSAYLQKGGYGSLPISRKESTCLIKNENIFQYSGMCMVLYVINLSAL